MYLFYFRGRNTTPPLLYGLSVKLSVVGCYIMVSEQFVPIEPEDRLIVLLCILCVCVYVLLGYLIDICGINVHEHAFGT